MPLIAADIFLPWEHLLQTIILTAVVILLVIAAYGDAKKRRIPNTLTAAIAILSVLRLVVIGDPIATFGTIVTALLVLFVTFLLFWRGFMGGGDVKLLTATVLLIGYHDLYPFLVTVSICGALVSIAILVRHKFASVVVARPSVPYGVAIAAGAFVTLFSHSSISG